MTRPMLRFIAQFLLSLCFLITSCGGDGCAAGDCSSVGGPTDIRLEVEDFILGLDKPWDIAWLPSGTVLVTERPGRLNVYVDGVGAAPFVVAPDDVVPRGEGGMMGLEVDPDFANNGFVYVCTTSNAGGDNDVRLLRLT
ncbi:MAG: PQQ-dependent sugar dehydrogenase, partial [Polyangiales bacterium]